jgi:integrase
LQDTVVKQQLEGHCEQRRKCLTCDRPRPVKDYRRRPLDTVLGTDPQAFCQRTPRLRSFRSPNSTESGDLKLEQYLDEYIAAAGITEDKKGPLLRAAIGRTGKLSERSMSRVDAWYMVRRRARDAGIETAIGNHSFRAIGITDYLERGGDINIAKRMAGHSNVKTTELYDRRGDEVSFSEIERVGI